MITASEWAAYNAAVSRISDGAASSVKGLVLGWCRAHPDATVGEAREAAKLIMEGQVQGYDELASAFAAEWYDRQAEAGGIGLQNAVTCAVYSPAKSDDVARYQVRKLMNEGAGAFAKACGEYARNDALRALNETIIANAGRDRKKGVRFARVPGGGETCTFCLMLAGRGAVYHSRKSAGEFRHFHRHCDCKVVPGFENDPDAELVEGVRPKELRDQWRRFEQIESYELPTQQESALKAACTARRVSLARNPAELADLFEEASRSAWVDFAKQKTEENYRTTVGRFVRLLGQEFDARWECGTTVNEAGTTIYAKPNGDELWVASKISALENYLRFLPSDQAIVPDVETTSGFAEIKCPSSANKVSKRLRHAAAQLASQGYGEKKTYLGLHRMNDVERARGVAADVQASGIVENVWVVMPDGQILRP